jgi:hypothetical protein
VGRERHDELEVRCWHRLAHDGDLFASPVDERREHPIDEDRDRRHPGQTCFRPEGLEHDTDDDSNPRAQRQLRQPEADGPVDQPEQCSIHGEVKTWCDQIDQPAEDRRHRCRRDDAPSDGLGGSRGPGGVGDGLARSHDDGADDGTPCGGRAASGRPEGSTSGCADQGTTEPGECHLGGIAAGSGY